MELIKYYYKVSFAQLKKIHLKQTRKNSGNLVMFFVVVNIFVIKVS